MQKNPANAALSYYPLGRRSERRVNGQSTRYVYDGVQALGELREDANGNATLLTGQALRAPFGSAAEVKLARR